MLTIVRCVLAAMFQAFLARFNEATTFTGNSAFNPRWRPVRIASFPLAVSGTK